MPLLYPEAIEDVRLGRQMVSALMVGTNEIYVRFQKYSYERAGDFSLTLPDWANSYGVIMSGGGGGGRAGNGGNNQIGHGGTGGRMLGVFGKITSTSPGRVVRGTIGAGGLGGTSSHANGQNGGSTSFTTHTPNTYIAEGGTGYPSSGKQDGGITSITFNEPYHKYYELSPGSSYTNGPAGKNNGGDGRLGGGGAGGNGGVFNSYTHGGNGGSGFVHIYVWGMYRN